MSEPTHTDSHPPVEAPDLHALSESSEVQNDRVVTVASKEWLHKSGSKIKRWIGHAVRFLPSEAAINLGTGFATFGALGTILTGAPIPMLFAAAGGAMLGTGVGAEWKAMKHAKSEGEKKLFWLSKLGQTVGTSAASMLSFISAPVFGPIATGLYMAGVGMGARAMSHRK